MNHAPTSRFKNLSAAYPAGNTCKLIRLSLAQNLSAAYPAGNIACGDRTQLCHLSAAYPAGNNNPASSACSSDLSAAYPAGNDVGHTPSIK